jgi:hypothetical protein
MSAFAPLSEAQGTSDAPSSAEPIYEYKKRPPRGHLGNDRLNRLDCVGSRAGLFGPNKINVLEWLCPLGQSVPRGALNQILRYVREICCQYPPVGT